jgi:tetratricopeptide (TPR) repeat protein
MEIISMKCPSCGASITTQTKQCDYCQSDILVKSFKNLAAMPLPQVNKYMAAYQAASAEHPDNNDVNAAVGLCFLRLKKYDQALNYLEKAQADNFEDATPFFYAAVARLKGRKPFLLNRQEIDQIMTDIEAAMSIEPKAEQYYFMSYIKRDYFKRKFLNTTPSWEEYMQEAVDNGLSAADVEEFHAMVGTPVDIEL